MNIVNTTLELSGFFSRSGTILDSKNKQRQRAAEYEKEESPTRTANGQLSCRASTVFLQNSIGEPILAVRPSTLFLPILFQSTLIQLEQPEQRSFMFIKHYQTKIWILMVKQMPVWMFFGKGRPPISNDASERFTDVHSALASLIQAHHVQVIQI